MKLWFSIFAVLVLLVAGFFLWQHFRPDPPPVPSPPVAGHVEPTVTDNIAHGDPALPKPDESMTGVLRVTIPADTNRVGPSPEREVFIYIDRDPEKPPQVYSNTPVQAAFTPVVDRWLVLEARLMVGAGSSTDAYASPWGGVSLVRLFRAVNLGAGVDRTAFGLFASCEFFREWNVGAMWYALPIRDTHARAGIFVAYRF